MRIAIIIAVVMLMRPTDTNAQTSSTELEAMSYVKSAFITGAAPGILAPDVVVAPRLRERLLLPANADAPRIYEALFTLTEDKVISVRTAIPAEAASYFGPSRADSPVVVLEAPKTILVMVYDPKRKQVSFIGFR